MPYTLAKFFLWGIAMAIAGGVIGWLLRSLKCRAELATARAKTGDEGELDRLRGRVANLEPAVAERDRLRMELADVRGSSAGVLGFSPVPGTSTMLGTASLPADGEPGGAGSAVAAELDLVAASSVIGMTVILDDLTMIEGIGPKIAELCSGIGITTWQQLARADVADLQAMLDAGGARFQMHKPASWPEQAGLLAAGKWAEFAALLESFASPK